MQAIIISSNEINCQFLNKDQELLSCEIKNYTVEVIVKRCGRQNTQRVSKAVLVKLMEEKDITHTEAKTHPSQAIPSSLQKLTLLTEVIKKKSMFVPFLCFFPQVSAMFLL